MFFLLRLFHQLQAIGGPMAIDLREYSRPLEDAEAGESGEAAERERRADDLLPAVPEAVPRWRPRIRRGRPVLRAPAAVIVTTRAHRRTDESVL